MKRPSLQSILIVPFLVQVTAAVGITGWLSIRNGQQAVSDLAQQLIGEKNNRVTQHLDSYFDGAAQVVKFNLDKIERGILDIDNFDETSIKFWHQVNTFDISYVSFISPKGTYIGAGYWLPDDPTIYMDRLGPEDNNMSDTFILDETGNRVQLEAIYYEPLEEEAYTEPVARGSMGWGSIYYWLPPHVVAAVAIGSPIYDDSQELIGVIAVDIMLDSINEFLQTIGVSSGSRIFIVEPDGALVASSADDRPYRSSMIGENDEPQRLQSIEAQDALTGAAAEFLTTERPNGFQSVDKNQAFVFDHSGQKYFAMVAPWQHEYGLDWRVVIAVPESDFMAQIQKNTQQTILLCWVALGAALALGMLTARWINRSVLKLSWASEQVAVGNLDVEVEASPIREINGLGHAFNNMAQKLRDSFQDLEQVNTQLTRLNTDLEDRVTERTAALQQAKEDADEANQAKSDFLARMSHELRTPLNGILGYAQILSRSTALPQKEQQGINIIHQCGSHLLTLINDILDLSKIEARKLELLPLATNLQDLLQNVVEICTVKAEQKGVAFVYQPSSRLPGGVEVDKKRLRQVLINLLGNAIKFTEQGSVTLIVDTVEQSDTHATILFEVRDTGTGIAEADLLKLFETFTQVGDRKKQSEGTGLGLAISQQIIELMGSTIQVKSRLSEGSEFFFTLALPLTDEWQQRQWVISDRRMIGYILADGTSSDDIEPDERIRILVVDDRWENRAVLLNLLEPCGFEVIEAEDGMEALEKLERTQPNLMITDLSMPIMDGFELLRHIRSRPDLKSLNVIVSSASVSLDDQQRSIDEGGDYFLPKPVNAKVLFRMVAESLDMEWIYQPLIEPERVLDPLSILPPPVSVLRSLLDLVQSGHILELQEQLKNMQQQDTQFASFYESMIQLAGQFQMEQLERTLQDYLEQRLAHAE